VTVCTVPHVPAEAAVVAPGISKPTLRDRSVPTFLTGCSVSDGQVNRAQLLLTPQYRDGEINWHLWPPPDADFVTWRLGWSVPAGGCCGQFHVDAVSGQVFAFSPSICD
jgi:hypothetical protein